MRRGAFVVGMVVVAACGQDETGVPDARVAAIDTFLDQVPPEASGDAAATFLFHSLRPDAAFTCVVDDGAPEPCTSPLVVTVGEGEHTFAVTSASPSGYADDTPAEHAWRVDLTAPGLAIDASPGALDNSSAALFSFRSTEPGSTFLCALDGAEPTPCDATTIFAVTAGEHTLEVWAVDPAGNQSESVTFTWTVDLTIPDTVITSGATGLVGGALVGFTFDAPTAGAGATFGCALDGAAFTACTSPRSYAAVATGPHAFQVQVTTAAGTANPTPALRLFTADSTPPAVAITAGPADPTVLPGLPEVTFTVGADAASVQCQVVGGPAFVACTSPWTGPAVGNGPHLIEVRATDALGNAASDSHAWTQAIPAPPTISYAGSPAALTRTIAASLAPTLGGGPVEACSADALPPGLTIDSACVITGTPTAPSVATDYTITASNTGGSGQAVINIAVADTCVVAELPFGGGDGTAAWPYLVCARAHLESIDGTTLPKRFRQTADLDLSALPFTPIGDGAVGLRGDYDGGGHSITAFHYSGPTDVEPVGLWRRVGTGGRVHDLTLVAPVVTGNNVVGAVAGFSEGDLVDLTVTGATVLGKGTVGGIVGQIDGTSTIALTRLTVTASTVKSLASGTRVVPNPGGTDCGAGGIIGLLTGAANNTLRDSSTTDVAVEWDPNGPYQTAYWTSAGGLIGYCGGARMQGVVNSHVEGGTVTGYWAVGGAVGADDSCSLADSWSSATVAGVNWVGGLVGALGGPAYAIFPWMVERSYATGDVNGASAVGGLVGQLYKAVRQSYATGNVSGTGYIGGLIGVSSGGALDSYSLGDVTGVGTSGGFIGSGYIGDYTTSYSGAATLAGATAHGFAGELSAGVYTSTYYLDTGAAADPGSTPLDATALVDGASFIGFDFLSVWTMPTTNAGRPLAPVLQWQCGLAGVDC